MTDEQRPAPASDEEIAGYNGEIAIYQRDPHDRLLHCVQCDASPGHMGGHRPGCDFTVWPRIRARIDQQRETIAALQARADKAEAEVERLVVDLEASERHEAANRIALAQARAEVERLRGALEQREIRFSTVAPASDPTGSPVE